MRESHERQIIVEDCNPATFKAMLQFLYTDDFGHVEKMVEAAHAEEGLQSKKRVSLLQDLLAPPGDADRQQA